ncbi:MAG: histidinol dehydrogenase, partial [Bacteroidaceae bacterium]|nr:histidinol dehydrogenase [Bacteroidaceae bacterium]
MKIVSYPTKEELSELVKRSSVKDPTLASTVRSVLARVRQEGDKALLALEQQFDAPLLTDIVVTSAEMEAASAKVDDSLKKAIQTAKRNIELFHRSQKLVVNPVETTPGVVCWQQQVAIQSVGLYIPGGTAPLFST